MTAQQMDPEKFATSMPKAISGFESCIKKIKGPLQIICKVMLPESVPSLLSNGVIALTTILGYSAMSGILGGGGLGKIAIQYGYYRYKYLVMLFAVLLLILLVQLFQTLGTRLATKLDRRLR